MNTQKQIALIVTLSFVLVAGCAAYSVIDLPIRAEDQTQWHFDESVERGALLYANNCRTCHGIRGEGFVGPPLNPLAGQTNFDFQNQDPLVLARNRALLERTLYCGRAGTRMPAWLNENGGSLNERQIEHIIDFITAPPEETEDGELVAKSWEHAVEFAHNLNHETSLVVGGDTLGSIARQHNIGIPELLALNPSIQDPSLFLEEGTIVRLPASSQARERDFEVDRDRLNLLRISDEQHVGTMILADLNQIPYELNDGAFVIGEKPEVSVEGVGLFPGAVLQLPGDAVYVLRPDDTIDLIAELHNARAQDIVSLNRDKISTNDTSQALEAFVHLALPENPTYIVQPGDTAASIEEIHGLDEDSLADADVTPGATIELPAGTEYIVQQEDTLASIAATHGIQEAELAELNDLEPGAPIRPEVVLDLPESAQYVVQGQSLEDITDTLGGVTAADLGEAQDPPVEADHVYAVGTTLHMPEDAYGSAPPDAINPGTACVEHAVPASIFEQITGGGASDEPEAPEEVSTDVEIVSNALDWTVIADGEESEPNEGVVKVAVGTTVTFRNVVGFHTVTVNGETEVEQFQDEGQTYERVFDEAGSYKITCDIHPDMLAWVFAE